MSPAPQLLLVVGVGRSGTSAFSGSVAALGYSVPQPEVRADETNPRGFGEPRWVVDFHAALLEGAQVTPWDARSYAWRHTRSAGEQPEVVAKLRAWLTTQFERHDRIVVKDPRTAWFLRLWDQVSRELGVDTSYVTLLRSPAEAVMSAGRWYQGPSRPTTRACGWMNVQLRTERQTRDSKRAFIRYTDLLTDWRSVLSGLNAKLDLGLDLRNQAAIEQVDAWLDPGLRREQTTLADLELPAAVRTLVERVWHEFDSAVDRDDRALQLRLDELRVDYRRLYRDSEQITHSSIVAARWKASLKAGGGAPSPQDDENESPGSGSPEQVDTAARPTTVPTPS